MPLMINKSMAGDLIGKRKEHALMSWSIPIAAAILKLECLVCSLRLYQELGFQIRNADGEEEPDC